MSRNLETEPSPRDSKRPRVLVACQRCKTRRQKCDNGTPTCSNCTRGHATCTYSENVYPSSYVKLLEERVGVLEAQLGALRPNSITDHLQNPRSTANQSMNPPVQRERPPLPLSSQLATGLGLLSSCAVAEPHYFGFSSGLSLAHLIQTAIDTGSSTPPEALLPSLADQPFSRPARIHRTPPASLPSKAMGSRFIKAYLSIIHPLYPFLDRSQLHRIHEKATEKATVVHSDTQLDLIVLHLVYAIGARCIQLVNPSDIGKDTPESHFVSAMNIIPEAIKYTSIRAIEITLLLAINSMRNPSGTSVWHLCGLAMRQCLEVGLHKQRIVPDRQIASNEARKKLFWSVYLFERKTALVVGRPFAISDKEIDADIPLNLSEDENDAATSRHSGGPGPNSRRSSITLHRHHILLYHIHTRIRFVLRRLKQSITPGELERKMTARFDELEEWKDKVLDDYRSDATTKISRSPSKVSRSHERSSDSAVDSAFPFDRSDEIEKTELLLEYQKARRSLLQPLMTEAHHQYSFKWKDFAACADASGQICQLYRRLHRLSPIPFSLRDLHAVFVAGVTLVYAICLKPTLYDTRRIGDIGACSTVLYVIAEQWPSAKRYRDAFETVAEKLVERARKAIEASNVTKQSRSSLEEVVECQSNPPQDSQQQVSQEFCNNLSGSAIDSSNSDPEYSSRTTFSSDGTGGNNRKLKSRYEPTGELRNYHITGQDDNWPEMRHEQGEDGHNHTTPDRDTMSTDLWQGSDLLYADSPQFRFDISNGLDLDLNDIGGLLSIEGMDWFTESVMRH